MKKIKLKNGLTIIIEPRKSKSVVIEACIKVGSVNENPKSAGISHFIEHMLFEGTKKYKDSKAISNEIEKLGGDINAATGNERTYYYVKVPKKHFDIALEIITQMIRFPLFENKKVIKERKIVTDEVNLITDDPKYHQFILFQKTLFEKHPARNPVYGSKKTVKGIKQKDALAYYKKFYNPNNMVLVVVGDVKSAEKKIREKFEDFKKKEVKPSKKVEEPKQKKRLVKEKRKTMQSYMVMGYKTVPRKHKDSYTLDVIRAVLGRGQSGRLFDEIRAKLGLAYDIGIFHQTGFDFGCFSAYLSTQKSNLKKVEGLIYQEFQKLKDINSKTLKEAKTFLEGETELDSEENLKHADNLAFWELAKDSSELKNYIKKIKKVTKDDVKRAVNKYLTKDYVMAVIEQN
ncbi:M16 family metallopeptidase [Nanoarchaeota archaeon]